MAEWFLHDYLFPSGGE